jgi:asparagine N-glycosylation enzyme membrane subunit Stt3
MEFNWLGAVGLFFASAVLEAIFGLYTLAVTKHKAIEAATWSLVSYFLLAVGILNFIHNKWYVIPLALGAFCGTFAVVKREAAKKTKT